MSVSLLDENFLGYLDPKNFAHPALGALIVSGAERCSCFDSLLPKQTIGSLWKSLLSGGGVGILMICLVGNKTFQVPEKAKN